MYGNTDPALATAVEQALLSLPPEELIELDRLITPRAAELLLKAFGPGLYPLLKPLIAKDEPAGRARTEAELRRLMADPKYWRDHDPEIMATVTQGFRQLYPQGPAEI